MKVCIREMKIRLEKGSFDALICDCDSLRQHLKGSEGFMCCSNGQPKNLIWTSLNPD